MKNLTLNQIKEHDPRKDSWERLLTHLGKIEADDKPLSLLTILESNGFEDTLWCTRCIDLRTRTDLKLRFIRPIIHMINRERDMHIIAMAEHFIAGNATDEEIAADDDAGDEAYAAYAAYDAAYAAYVDADADADADAAARADVAADAAYTAYTAYTFTTNIPYNKVAIFTKWIKDNDL